MVKERGDASRLITSAFFISVILPAGRVLTASQTSKDQGCGIANNQSDWVAYQGMTRFTWKFTGQID